MTVTTTNAQAQYTGDGSTTQFPFSFVVLEEDDMDVLLTNTTDSTLDGIAPFSTTQLTLNDDYSITISNPGGTVDLSGGNNPFGAPSNGIRITLLRDTDFTQEIDYLENDPFPADTHETGLDRAVLRDQEIEEALDRLVRTQVGDQTTNLELPLTTERSDKVLAFDSNGNAIAQDIGNLEVQVNLTSPASGDLLIYDASNSQFTNSKSLVSSGGTIVESDVAVDFTATVSVNGNDVLDTSDLDANGGTVLEDNNSSLLTAGFFSDPQTLSISSNQTSIDAQGPHIRTLTINADTEIQVPSNLTGGASIIIIATNDGTGGYQLTFASGYTELAGSQSYDSDANAVNIIQIISDGNNVWYNIAPEA
jgi:hypothetical protein